MAFACSNFQMKQGEMPFSLPSYTCTDGIAKKTLSFAWLLTQKNIFQPLEEVSADGDNGIGNKMFNQKAVWGESRLNECSS